jgi:hypothetical protein
MMQFALDESPKRWGNTSRVTGEPLSPQNDWFSSAPGLAEAVFGLVGAGHATLADAVAEDVVAEAAAVGAAALEHAGQLAPQTIQHPETGLGRSAEVTAKPPPGGP